MRIFALALVGFGCLITLSDCSSPFLPHNAVKYIPELSHAENMETPYSKEASEPTQQNEVAASEDYFSPENIKERYTQHIEECESTNSEPILESEQLPKDETSSEKITAWKDADKTDVLLASIQVMQQHGTTQEEIMEMLTEKFGLTKEEAQLLLEQTLEENSP